MTLPTFIKEKSEVFEEKFVVTEQTGEFVSEEHLEIVTEPLMADYVDGKLLRAKDVKEFLTQAIKESYALGEESKNGAYKERDMLVCALSKLFPAHLARHSEEDKEWEDDWRWIVYIELPTGQVSWHIHDSEREMFNHLEVGENKWDGHNTERKYERLMALASLQKELSSIREI